MDLYFLRHGKAEERALGGSDAERRLTERGIAEMRAEAVGIAARKLQIDAIISSPLPRALQTAELVATAFGLPPSSIRIEAALVSGQFDLSELQRLLAGKPREYRVLFVGHEPDLSYLVQVLIGGEPVEMKKGALALVETERVAAGGGVLRWLAPPKSLITHADQR